MAKKKKVVRKVASRANKNALKYTNSQIVAELRRVFEINNEEPYSRREYEALGTISKTTIENRFGSWTEALKQARLYNRFMKKGSRTRKTA